mmetsp:Transcript_11616/g.32306  ORF Transcript_11616/g.32306 Transcript_11616/m.32306 type:complete len:424 (+) Transcript_11616:566-1837(+)
MLWWLLVLLLLLLPLVLLTFLCDRADLAQLCHVPVRASLLSRSAPGGRLAPRRRDSPSPTWDVPLSKTVLIEAYARGHGAGPVGPPKVGTYQNDPVGAGDFRGDHVLQLLHHPLQLCSAKRAVCDRALSSHLGIVGGLAGWTSASLQESSRQRQDPLLQPPPPLDGLSAPSILPTSPSWRVSLPRPRELLRCSRSPRTIDQGERHGLRRAWTTKNFQQASVACRFPTISQLASWRSRQAPYRHLPCSPLRLMAPLASSFFPLGARRVVVTSRLHEPSAVRATPLPPASSAQLVSLPDLSCTNAYSCAPPPALRPQSFDLDPWPSSPCLDLSPCLYPSPWSPYLYLLYPSPIPSPCLSPALEFSPPFPCLLTRLPSQPHPQSLPLSPPLAVALQQTHLSLQLKTPGPAQNRLAQSPVSNSRCQT